LASKCADAGDDERGDRLLLRISGSGRVAALAMALAVTPVPTDLAAYVKLAIVAEKLDQPLGMAFATGDPAKRLFIVEKTGAIRVLKGGKALAEPFLDLRARVSRGSEQGLLGLAFHRGYMTTGRLYVNYTDKGGDTHVVELTVASPAADRATVTSERELLFVEQPYPNHNGGHLVMTQDGWLLVGLGDGGSGGDPKGNARNPKSLLGKMLRLDPETKIDVLRTRILARGVRNPWRYAIDRATGHLYIGDVGQDRWEEVDVVPMASLFGKDFGWNVMEGFHCFRGTTCNAEGLTPPVVEYGHDAGCSITGGVVYRGTSLPRLAGLYFYADYCTGLLRSFRFTSGVAADQWDWKKALDAGNRLAQIASFGEDEAGEVYIIGLGGTIWKFVPAK
jgi:glucose/arabinose dehydrogenase